MSLYLTIPSGLPEDMYGVLIAWNLNTSTREINHTQWTEIIQTRTGRHADGITQIALETHYTVQHQPGTVRVEHADRTEITETRRERLRSGSVIKNRKGRIIVHEKPQMPKQGQEQVGRETKMDRIETAAYDPTKTLEYVLNPPVRATGTKLREPRNATLERGILTIEELMPRLNMADLRSALDFPDSLAVQTLTSRKLYDPVKLGGIQQDKGKGHSVLQSATQSSGQVFPSQPSFLEPGISSPVVGNMLDRFSEFKTTRTVGRTSAEVVGVPSTNPEAPSRSNPPPVEASANNSIRQIQKQLLNNEVRKWLDNVTPGEPSEHNEHCEE